MLVQRAPAHHPDLWTRGWRAADAFIVPQPGKSVSVADMGRLSALVLERLSTSAVPARYFVCAGGLPETYSGKIQRRVLRLLVERKPIGSTSAMKNPDCVPMLHAPRGS